MFEQRVKTSLALVVSATGLLSAQSTQPGDWPQWRGPSRDGISLETGLLEEWPPSGPALVWSAGGLGQGYGSVAVGGDRVFVQMRVGRQSAVASLGVEDGRIVWARAIGQGRDNDRGPGPRGTPTLDGDRVYVLTENGDLACLRAAD
jgi:outer membrane protein assembly factor BamB